MKGDTLLIIALLCMAFCAGGATEAWRNLNRSMQNGPRKGDRK